MRYDDLPAALRAWLEETLALGTDRAGVLDALRAAGYGSEYARAAVDAAFARPRPPAPAVAGVALAPTREGLAAAAVASEPAVPAAVFPNRIEVSDRCVDVLFALEAPRIILFGGLLSDEECDALIEASRGKLERSSVVNNETGAYDVHPHRTSLGTHFRRGETELVRRIERRIAQLLEFPEAHGEPIQILHYLPGGEYRPHFDYFDPQQPGSDKVLAMGGQRIATLIMYLNDCEQGGATTFPKVGVSVLPKRGNAVYFAYTAPDGALDARSLHGGAPVRGGEKWIATKWLREYEYAGPSAG
jgi:prolyl 4-hydroxylase